MRRSSPDLPVRCLTGRRRRLTPRGLRRARRTNARGDCLEGSPAQPPLEGRLHSAHAPGRERCEDQGDEPDRYGEEVAHCPFFLPQVSRKRSARDRAEARCAARRPRKAVRSQELAPRLSYARWPAAYSGALLGRLFPVDSGRIKNGTTCSRASKSTRYCEAACLVANGPMRTRYQVPRPGTCA